MHARTLSRREEVLREAEETVSVIHLAGGCFWGLQKYISEVPGVLSTECGYANGDPLYVPDYMLVCSGRMGYREAVKVVYDPELVDLETILGVFFYLIDPTQERGQGNDRGIQYQTGVYWTDSGSEEVVRKVFAEQEESFDEFHVEMGPLTTWTRAEEYHQDYLLKNPGGYCHIPVWKTAVLKQLLDRMSGLRSSRTGPPSHPRR